VLIAPKAEVAGPVDVALSRIGRQRRIAITVPHFLAAPAIVAGSDLVMTITQRIAVAMAGHHRLRIFDPPIAVPGFAVAMAWPPEREGDPAIDWIKMRLRALSAGNLSS
jgi:DNA-binding transcriptional LysR family regulator